MFTVRDLLRRRTARGPLQLRRKPPRQSPACAGPVRPHLAGHPPLVSGPAVRTFRRGQPRDGNDRRGHGVRVRRLSRRRLGRRSGVPAGRRCLAAGRRPARRTRRRYGSGSGRHRLRGRRHWPGEPTGRLDAGVRHRAEPVDDRAGPADAARTPGRRRVRRPRVHGRRTYRRGEPQRLRGLRPEYAAVDPAARTAHTARRPAPVR
jgi:hypothetical protein